MTSYHRTYTGADDLHKMQNLIAKAVAEVGYDSYMHIGDVPHRIYNGLRRYDPTKIVHLWEDNAGELLGWVIVYPDEPAFDLQIMPSLRGSDIHIEIAKLAVKYTKELCDRAKKSSPILCDTIGNDPETKKVLDQLGFKRVKPYLNITMRSLENDIPEHQFPEGFTIRSVEGVHEAEQLVDVHSKSFGSSWTTELYCRVMESPGYEAQNEIVVIAPDGGDPVLKLSLPPTPALNQWNGEYLEEVRAEAYGVDDSVYATIHMQNGVWQYNAGGVPQDLIDYGVIMAIDVWEQGGDQYFDTYERVCLLGEGRLIYFDATQSPRPQVEITLVDFENGYTCGWIPNAGTLVLIRPK